VVRRPYTGAGKKQNVHREPVILPGGVQKVFASRAGKKGKAGFGTIGKLWVEWRTAVSSKTNWKSGLPGKIRHAGTERLNV